MSGSAVTEPPRTEGRKRILFVDDDRPLLDGLHDGFWRYHKKWRMKFVTSGEEALDALQAQPYDIVVSDLRMPVMDGARLLALVRDQHPGIVRIVLSGQADLATIARAAAVAHRLIAKPSSTQELAAVIERSCEVQDLASRIELARRAIGASSLPSVPSLYAELTSVIASKSAGAADAARVVERDTAMAAKVLQLANSAYFSRRSSVSSLSTAVGYIGMDALRALVLQAEAFHEFRADPPIPGFDVESLQRHCSRVAQLARTIASSDDAHDDAFTAGLLHDVGLLVLASHNREELAAALVRSRQENRALAAVERETYGVTHAELGAHLLALWGLPLSVTEAVAHHHDEQWPALGCESVRALYVANAFVAEAEAGVDDRALASPQVLARERLADASYERWREFATDLVRGCARS